MVKQTHVVALCAFFACGGTRAQAVEIAPLPSPAASATASAAVEGPREASTVVAGIHPISLAVDGANVYWVDEDHAIRKASIAGGKPVTIATGDYPTSIAVGRSDVYWIDDPGKSFVRAVPIAGGARRDVGTDEHLKLWAVATDDSNVYWADYFAIYVAPFDAPQSTRTLTCAQGMMHLAVGPTHVACDGVLSKSLALTPLAGGASRVLAPMDAQVALAIDATDVYWTSGEHPTSVMRASLTGGAPVAILSNASLQKPIAVADAHAFVARADGAILSVPRDAAPPTEISAPRAEKFVALVAQPRWLYVALADSILRVPR